jgi:hypothetical protein
VYRTSLFKSKMPKSGLKAKAISAPRYNLYKHRLSPFLGSFEAFLRTAKGQDPEDEAINDVHRRSWTREQKLGAIKYATLTFILGKTGQDELISNKAAAYNIGCTPKCCAHGSGTTMRSMLVPKVVAKAG